MMDYAFLPSPANSLISLDTSPPSTCSSLSSFDMGEDTLFQDDLSRFSPTSLASINHKYWFEDGSAIIKVEGSRYKLHASLLKQHSPLLNGKLSALMPGNKRKKETKQSWDLFLEVRSDHFELLLSILYPTELGVIPEFTDFEWLSLLEVSSQLNFPVTRKAAVEHILNKETDTMKLVHYGLSLQIEELLFKGFHDLCTRPHPLTHDEGQQLGVGHVIELARAREQILKNVAYEVIWKQLKVWALDAETIGSPKRSSSSP